MYAQINDNVFRIFFYLLLNLQANYVQGSTKITIMISFNLF